MTVEEDRVLAVVAVRCTRCAAKYGRGTLLGEMSLWPDSLGGGWRWRRTARQKIHPDGTRATQLTNADDQRTGGVEAKCRRCGSAPRFKIATLAALAAAESDHPRPSILI